MTRHGSTRVSVNIIFIALVTVDVDAHCCFSITDNMSETDGTGIRSRGILVALRTPLGNVNDSLLPASTSDPSGRRLRIQMNSVSSFYITCYGNVF